MFDSGQYWSIATPLNPNETLTGCPLFIDASRIPLLFESARPQLQDVRASVTGQQIPCYVFNVDRPNNRAIIAISLNKTTGNQPIKIHWGSTGDVPPANSEFGQYNVFNSGTVAFYPSGAGADLTRNQRHSTNPYNTWLHPNGQIIQSDIQPTGTPINGLTGSFYGVSGVRFGANWYFPYPGGSGAPRSYYTASGTNLATGTFTTFFYPIDITGLVEGHLIETTGNGETKVLVADLSLPNSGNLSLSVQDTDNVSSVNINDFDLNQWQHVGSHWDLNGSYLGLVKDYDFIETLTTGFTTTNPVENIYLGSGFIGALTLTSIHNENLPLEWSKYRSLQGNQSVFWGDWETPFHLLTGIVKSKTNFQGRFAIDLKSIIGAKSYYKGELATSSTYLEDNWSGYYTITPDNPPEQLEDIPVILDLTLLPYLQYRVKKDGSDIRISDENGIRIPIDVVGYSGGTGLVIMNFGTKTTGTQNYRLWWGNPNADFEPADGLFGKNRVYNSDIWGYYPSGGDDRTSYAHHLTHDGIFNDKFIASPFSISGIQYEVTDAMYSDEDAITGDFTAFGWFYQPENLYERYGHIWSLGDTGFGHGEYWNALALDRQTNTVVATQSVNSSDMYNTGHIFGLSGWNHAVAVFSGSYCQPFLNASGGNLSGIDPSLAFPPNRTVVGRASTNGNVDYLGETWLSVIQLHSVPRSSGWIRYDYMQGDQVDFWSIDDPFEPIPNLVAQWPCQDYESDYVVKAYSDGVSHIYGNRNSVLDGTIVGNPLIHSTGLSQDGPGGYWTRSLNMRELNGFGNSGNCVRIPTGYGIGRNATGLTLMSWFRIPYESGLDSETSSLINIGKSSTVNFWRAALRATSSIVGNRVSGFFEMQTVMPDSMSYNARTESSGLYLDEWHHLVGVDDYINKAQYLYLDGQLHAVNTGSANFPLSGLEDTEPAHLHLGAEFGFGMSSTGFLSGYIADARIYHRALTQNEIERIYNLGTDEAEPVYVQLNSVIQSYSSFIGTLGSDFALNSTINGKSNFNALYLNSLLGLNSNIEAKSNFSGNIKLELLLVGEIKSSSSLTPLLELDDQLELFSTIRAKSNLGGKLDLAQLIESEILAKSGLGGTLGINLNFLDARVDAKSGFIAGLTLDIPLSSVSKALSNLSGRLNVNDAESGLNIEFTVYIKEEDALVLYIKDAHIDTLHITPQVNAEVNVD